RADEDADPDRLVETQRAASRRRLGRAAQRSAFPHARGKGSAVSDSTKAVFLSYAREDTDAARRIADALRGFGVEVWFDQAELRGGDAWDAQIRKQIRECALFIPVISARTEARGEGYFRLEWNLAD